MAEIIPVKWNGRTIRRREDGYFNATDMCQSCGKLVADWYKLDATRKVLTQFSADMQIPITGIIQLVRGGLPYSQGTWVHPEVAVSLAMWLSPDFHVFVVGLVRKWAEGKLVSAPVEENEDLLIYRAIKLLEQRVKENEADAIAFRRIAASEGSQNLTDTAKLLRVRRRDLIARMHANRWIYRRPTGKEWIGYDQHTKNGDLEHVALEFEVDGRTINRVHVLVTMQGIAKLTKLFTGLQSNLSIAPRSNGFASDEVTS